ncbi:MAG: hypothetical protein GEU90_04690 [Gemmatimonas sp.]|nr:hypothetical protein [Gemmatimonas sp.]
MSSAAPVDLNPPGDVRWISERLESAGFAAWAVGGAVRDALAGGKPVDWDMATPARPAEVRRIFPRTVPIGIEYGTMGVLARSGKMYEVTTFRRDVEAFGRKARVVFAATLEEDLQRRDFTINAVAWRPRTGELSDPHGGVEDLQRGVLRTVGEPEERFTEDRLRVLRALRFAGRFGLRIEDETWAAIERSAGKLDHLSAERIREELWKVLTGREPPSRSLALYAETGVLAALYPELERCQRAILPDEGSVWSQTLRAVDVISPTHPLVRLAALLHAVGLEGDQGSSIVPGKAAGIALHTLRRLRFSNADTDRVVHLIAQQAPLPPANAPAADLRGWLRRVGKDYVNDLFRLLFAICPAGGIRGMERTELLAIYRRARREIGADVPLTVNELAIGGQELRRLGIAPGPVYGEILNRLLDRVIEEPELNEPTRLLRIVREEVRPG